MTEVEFSPLAEGDNVMLNLELYSLGKDRNGVKVNGQNSTSLV